MNKKIILFLFLLLFSVSTVCAIVADEKNLEYLGVMGNQNSTFDKVSYYITYPSDVYLDKFLLGIYLNGTLKDSCEKELSPSAQILAEKITCDVKDYGTGEYMFIATLSAKDVVYVTSKENVYVNSESNLYMEFESIGNKTLVFITVNLNGEDLVVLNNISKTVIPMLTDENRDSLIESDFKYEIIESDPLIAWTVDRAPVKINYTINKAMSAEDKKNFTIKLQDESVFNKIQWLIYILIIGIIALAIRPAFKKNK